MSERVVKMDDLPVLIAVEDPDSPPREVCPISDSYLKTIYPLFSSHLSILISLYPFLLLFDLPQSIAIHF